jgi:retinol dehydrogenase-12
MADEMADKVVLITGATNGIGKAAAWRLTRMGAHMVIVGRNASKTADVARELRAQSGNRQVDMIVSDLSLLSGIRRAADTFRERYDRLDVLVNNVGALFMRRQLTADGLEATFALNHLSYFLLTNLLLEPLRASDGARVISVSSDAHRSARGMDFEDLQGERSYNGFRAYAQSKLANILFSSELARRLEGSGMTSNSVHPGFVNSGFGKNNDGPLMLLFRVFSPLVGRTPEQGAQTVVHLASAPDVAGISGQYFVDMKAVSPSSAAQDSQQAGRLWAVSEEMTGLATTV